jgi:hypothetical protein
MTVEYWETMQRALRDGKVPRIRSYPDGRRLRREHEAEITEAN